MLWINLIMDSLASVALSTENPHEKLLLRKPYTRNDNIVSKLMKKNIIGHSIYQMIVMVALIFFGDRYIPEYPDSLDATTYSGENQKFKWTLDDQGKIVGTVCSGRFYTFSGGDDYVTAFDIT
jgi:P-type Ca2+ transporter type 2B